MGCASSSSDVKKWPEPSPHLTFIELKLLVYFQDRSMQGQQKGQHCFSLEARMVAKSAAPENKFE
jgi:hypothetical protein